MRGLRQNYTRQFIRAVRGSHDHVVETGSVHQISQDLPNRARTLAQVNQVSCGTRGKVDHYPRLGTNRTQDCSKTRVPCINRQLAVRVSDDRLTCNWWRKILLRSLADSTDHRCSAENASLLSMPGRDEPP